MWIHGCGMMFIDHYGSFVAMNPYAGVYEPDYGVRPVVSLKSDISASKNRDVWQLEN